MKPVPGPLSPPQLRSFFPAATRYAYLNAAGASPLATPVCAAQHAVLREMEQDGDTFFPAWLERRENLRHRLAAFFDARAHELAFMPSTSMGFSVVADAFCQLGVRRVLTLSTEFPSTTLPLLHRGLELSVVEPRPDGSFSVEQLENACTGATGAVAVSAVQYASGFRIDLPALSDFCRRRGLYLALNVAQAAGQVKVSVEETPVDFLCGTSHKWMMGGFGVGFFYAREALFASLKLPFASWLSTENPMAMNAFVGAHAVSDAPRVLRGASFRNTPSALETGVTSFVGLAGFDAALALLQGVGMGAVEAHNRLLQRQLRSRLRARGFTPNAPDEACVGLCVIGVKGHPHEVAAALHRQGVVVTARGGGLRLSTHVYNATEDLDRLEEAFQECGIEPSGFA